ncbi:uncharacterized protein LOC134818556 [Bolinopsis microptera]|uniref:uncharacterized protein LOC134818556 n=1 Tax=Bolinopsis microptera TaxID=2820187 RepID=UPI003078CA50
MSLKKIKRLLTFTRQGIVDYDQFYEGGGDEAIKFSSEDTSIFLMRLRGDKHTLKGSNVKLSEAELRRLGIGALMFGSYPVQKHDGVASKIHILENTKQIFMCYTFLDDRHLHRKERSPNTSGYGSYRSGSGSLVDYQERSTDDELQSTSVNSVSSIASSIASFASSIGISSFNGNKGSATTPDPPFSSSIPANTYLGTGEKVPGLKRVASSPSKLATQGLNSRKEKFGIGFLFKANCMGIDFEQLKSFIFERLHIIEAQAMECRKRLFYYLDLGKSTDYEQIINGISDGFLYYLNMSASVKRIGNLWQSVHLGGLVGSRQAKNNVADLICDLYHQYEGEKKFMSTVVTAILSANSTWHSNICDPNLQSQLSSQSRKFLDLYGGPGSNFPVRIAFISQDVTLLQGFLALTTYFQRNTVFVKSIGHKKAKFMAVDSSQLTLPDLACDPSEKVVEAVQSAVASGTFSLLSEDEVNSIESSNNSTTLNSVSSKTSMSDEGDLCPRFSTSFVDYSLSRKLAQDDMILPNRNNLPALSNFYHPSFPVMGLSSHDGLFKDFKCGFAALHEALKLSISEDVISKMVVNDATTFDCKVWVHDGTYQKICKITASSAVSRIIKNFFELKQLTGNSKLCLLYLESELQTLAHVREAYLTFCQLEPSPPQKFLDVFKMDKTDGEFFNLIKK